MATFALSKDFVMPLGELDERFVAPKPSTCRFNTLYQELVVEYSCDVRGKIRPTPKPTTNTTTPAPPKVNTSKLQVAPRESITIGSGADEPGLVVDGSTTLYQCQWAGASVTCTDLHPLIMVPNQISKYVA